VKTENEKKLEFMIHQRELIKAYHIDALGRAIIAAIQKDSEGFKRQESRAKAQLDRLYELNDAITEIL
jgi:hypothetical protein